MPPSGLTQVMTSKPCVWIHKALQNQMCKRSGRSRSPCHSQSIRLVSHLRQELQAGIFTFVSHLEISLQLRIYRAHVVYMHDIVVKKGAAKH